MNVVSNCDRIKLLFNREYFAFRFASMDLRTTASVDFFHSPVVSEDLKVLNQAVDRDQLVEVEGHSSKLY